ncbi:hypothetical protein SIID45300_02112 [Candidatus Magnetaquicoccaceae bacterium FCR-1]|uniref:BF1531-like N-terminal domain-containing protein n=1 Tax=Candidatus Magnetaquiglobus chichijimensis TaxID=3141448 RepID=A0ABQ0CA64_9PROT
MLTESLDYPFDIKTILRKRKAICQDLLQQPDLRNIRIALLGGSTTAEIRGILELFLLKSGFKPTFFESEYGKYFEDVVIDDTSLRAFKPDVAFIHTTNVNLLFSPKVFDSEERIADSLHKEMARYQAIWNKLITELHCQVIQNNFDLPPTRALGGLDTTEPYGKTHYILRLNLEFARAARQLSGLIINDIHYLSARIGLEQWFDLDYWFSYKMAVTHTGTVHLAHALATLIRAAYGKSRKCLVLDLDNTLWGGVIGDDGVQGIVLGKETPQGEAFTAFQNYCRELNERGILLAVCSKNDLENAQQGLTHPDMILQSDRFTAFKANWHPKPDNIAQIAQEINIGLDALVFVDDNPAERALVKAQLPPVAVPDVGSEVSRFIEFVDREGFFEVPRLNQEDARRTAYYADNAERTLLASQFADYGAFLASLEMKAEIGPFTPVYLDRITQLTNKTNQFNLTTKRCTLAEMQAMAASPDHITLYGRLADRFGDNGLVTVIAAKVERHTAHIQLWLMSCRVLKRDMEHAMLDALVARANQRGIREILGYYHRTAKNGMVADHYGTLGFECVAQAGDGSSSVWRLDPTIHQSRNVSIKDIHHA